MSALRSQVADKNIVNMAKRSRNPETAKAIKRTRARLNEGGRADFTADLLRHHAEVLGSLASVIPLAIIATAGAATFIGFGVQAIYWALLTICAYIVLGVFARRLANTEIEAINIPYWSNIMLACHIVTGLCWAWLAAFKCNECGIPQISVLQAVVLLLAMAGTAIATANMRRALLLTFVVPVASFIVFSAHLTNAVEISMVLMLIAGIAFFMVVANYLNNIARENLEHQSEKDALIAELETAKSMSDEARSRAEEANMAKSRFLASMSHELRTPLNAILGFSEVMSNEVLGPLDNPTYREYAQDIHDSGEHLLNLINEILDLSRVEAGRHSLTEEVMKLADTVEDAVHMMTLKARSKDIKIISNFEKTLTSIWTDERSIRQITLNLLSNAVKFTPTGGEITVKIGWTGGGGQYISVKDNGPGIPEDEIPIVLSTFGQGSIAIKNAEQGTGLGLPIVQALMHLHGGIFDLRSKLREGTEALAIFPRDRVVIAAKKIADAGLPPENQQKKIFG
jgi:two-component system, cell cycle sensor histidine kinase PleC